MAADVERNIAGRRIERINALRIGCERCGWYTISGRCSRYRPRAQSRPDMPARCEWSNGRNPTQKYFWQLPRRHGGEQNAEVG